MPVPVTITYRPLGLWPTRKTRNRSYKNSPFRAASSDSLAKLREELAAIHASNCVIECDAPDSQFNRDGSLRLNAYVSSPAIIVRFTDRHGNAVAMPCDTFNTWIDNARAIALTLEKLRAIDRYGVTKSGEQYAGFRAIPAFTGTAAAGIKTVNDAALFLNAMAPQFSTLEILGRVDVARTAWRQARAKTHPDSGGNETEFHKTTVAAKLLASHFGVALL